MTSYGWVIDKDYLPDIGAPEGTNQNAKGVMGPSSIPPDIADRLKAGEGIKFRMYDDDEELYYEGRYFDYGDLTVKLGTSEYITVPFVSGGGEDWFAPLNGFGAPNAGAVTIFYQDDNGDWGVL